MLCGDNADEMAEASCPGCRRPALSWGRALVHGGCWNLWVSADGDADRGIDAGLGFSTPRPVFRSPGWDFGTVASQPECDMVRLGRVNFGRRGRYLLGYGCWLGPDDPGVLAHDRGRPLPLRHPENGRTSRYSGPTTR